MLFAHIEEFFEDTAETQTYQVPLAIEGSNRAPRLYDAPVPVMESGVEMMLDDVYANEVYFQDLEQTEQCVQRSLLDILERDLFDPEDGVCTTQELCEQAQSMLDAGFIEDVDDFATACNYYFAKCAHDGDPWWVCVDGLMDLLDGDVPVEGVSEWKSARLEVIGVDFMISADGPVSMTVFCYERNEDGVKVYRAREAEVESWGLEQGDDDEEES